MSSHLCGRKPGIPLSVRGVVEAQALANRLKKPDLLISSPVERALETARIIGEKHGLVPIIVPEFAEFDFGDWTGRSFESLHDDPLWEEFNRDRITTCPPGGESMTEVLDRAVRAVDNLVFFRREFVAVISHGDVIRALLVHAAQTSLNSYWRFTVNPASITELDWSSESNIRILRANDTAHLENLNAA